MLDVVNTDVSNDSLKRDSFHMILLFICSLLAYDKTICICRDNDCMDSCEGSRDTIIDTRDMEDYFLFYSRISQALGRHKNVLIQIITPDYIIDIEFSFFIGRNLTILSKNSSHSPQLLVLKYSTSDDYSKTLVKISGIETRFENIDELATKIDLDFQILYFEPKSNEKLEFWPDNAEYSLKADSFSLPLKVCFMFKSINASNIRDSIYIMLDEGDSTKVWLDKNNMLLKYGEKDLIIYYNNRYKIYFEGDKDTSVKLSNRENSNFIPYFVLNSIQSVSINGDWNQFLNIVTGQIVGYPLKSIDIFLNSSIIPFQLSCYAANIYFETSCLITGNILSNYTLSLYCSDNYLENRLTVSIGFFYYSFISTYSSKFDISIQYYFPKGSITDTFPMEFAISEIGSATLSIWNYVLEIGNPINYYSYINIRSLVSENLQDEFFKRLYLSGGFIKIYEFSLRYLNQMKIRYTEDSVPNIYGITNTNVIGLFFNHQKDENFLASVQYVGGYPSELVRTLCYGNACAQNIEKVTDLYKDLTSRFISSSHHYYLILSGSITNEENLNINIEEINLITTFTLIIVDNFGFKNIDLVLPRHKVITELTLNNISVGSVNNIFSNSLILLNIRENDKTSAIPINSASIKVLSNSLHIMKRIQAESTLFFIEDINSISIDNGQYFINDAILNENQIASSIFKMRDQLSLSINNTDAITGFNISTEEDTNITYEGIWKNVMINNGINIFLSHYQNNIILKTNYIHNDIHYIGGSVSYIIDYDSPQDVCIYMTDSKLCPDDSNHVKYQSFNPLDLISDRVNLYFTGFGEEAVEIDLALFDKKQVLFSSIDASLKIDILLSKDIDLQLTSFTFENIEISPKEIKDLKFGYLNTYNTSFSSFENIEIYVYHFTCSYTNLASFKMVYIVKELSVDGIINDERTRIIFVKDSILNANIGNECLIHYQALGIVVGSMVFEFQAIEVNVNIFIKTEEKIQFECSIAVNIIKSAVIVDENSLIEFTGTWPSDKDLFSIKSDSDFKVSLKTTIGANLICKKPIHIIAASETCGILGNIDNLITISSTCESISNIFIDSNILNYQPMNNKFVIHLKSPNLNVTINEIGSNILQLLSSMLIFAFNELMAARLTIFSPLPSMLDLYRFDVCVESQIKGELKDDSFYKIIKNYVLVLKIVSNFYYFNPKLIYFNYDLDLTHGFNWKSSVFDLGISFSNNDVEFFLISMTTPSNQPYVIQYTSGLPSIEAELSITDPAKLDTMFNLVPKNIRNIKILISKEIESSHPIPLSFFNKSLKTITIELSGTGNIVFIDVLSSKIDILTLRKIKLYSISPIKLENIKSVFLDDVELLAELEVGNNNDLLSTDLKSYRSFFSPTKAPKFSKFIFQGSDYITFTEDGWILQEDILMPEIRIKQADASSISLNCSAFISLKIEKPRIQKAIIGLPIYMNQDMYGLLQVSFGSGWGAIKNMDNLFINHISYYQQVFIYYVDYPSPYVISSNYVIDSFDYYSNDELWFADDLVFFSDTSFLLELIKPEKAIIHGNHINIVQSCSISIFTDYAKYKFDSLEVYKDVIASITAIELTHELVMHPSSAFSFISSCTFTDLFITFHWENSSFPMITLVEENTSKTIPKQISVVLDDENPDYSSYYNYTYKKSYTIVLGSFNCYEWMEKIHFISKDQYFNDSSQLIFHPQCVRDQATNNFQLMIVGTGELPIDNDSDSSYNNNEGGLTNQTAIIIAVVVVVVVILLIGIIVYISTKLKYERLILRGRSHTSTTPSVNTPSTNSKEETEVISLTNPIDVANIGYQEISDYSEEEELSDY